MTRKVLAISLILARNMGVATVGHPNWGMLLAKLWKEWEPPVLVLLSLALQVILALFGDQRKSTRNIVIRFIIWSAFMAADSMAVFTLGVISSNLHEALIVGGSLSASTELATFWAPFLVLHLGGVDTVTAFALQDNELWVRHLLYLILETGLAVYIFVRVPKGSRLSILSCMMLVAGFIKYAERTLSLWFASYNNRHRDRAQLDEFDRDQAQLTQMDDEKVENELLAAKMFQMTERMFADALLQVDRKSSSKGIVKKRCSTMVSEIIAMELQLMYEDLYTKAKVTHSWWGLALRLISFLLILITLISFSFSCFHHRHTYSAFQLSVTFLLFVVAILLEGYATILFLTSCRTISWLKENGRHTTLPAMKCLSSLRTRRWSNSMGQFSLVNSSVVGPKPAKDLFREATSTFHWMILVRIMRKPELIRNVYESPVKDYVKKGIHEYLNQAEAKHINSRGRVPLTTWKEQRHEDHHGRAVDDPTTWPHFDEMEFGETVILWHFVTEVFYYLDYGSLIGWKDEPSHQKVYRDWKTSKYLSRYLMQLYVVSSDMLPPRGPLSEQDFFYYYSVYFCWVPRIESIGKAAAGDRPEKQRRKRENVQEFRDYWVEMLQRRTGNWENPLFVDAVNLLKVLWIQQDPQSIAAKESKLDQTWKLLSEVWIELLISAANQCKGNQHAQHLSQGGELLTHVWVLLGHLGLIKCW